MADASSCSGRPRSVHRHQQHEGYVPSSPLTRKFPSGSITTGRAAAPERTGGRLPREGMEGNMPSTCLRVFALVWVAHLGLGTVAASAPAAEIASATTVTVRIYRSSVRPADLAIAQRLASAIYQAAGVNLSWVHCAQMLVTRPGGPAGCDRPLAPGEMILHIAPAPASERTGASQALGFSLIDAAAGRATVATVYSDRVARLARDAGIPTPDLLARAMAHELGHLLLRTTSHPSSGLMRGFWSSAQLHLNVPQDWGFSASESRLLRRAVEERATPRPALERLLARGERPVVP